MHPRPRLNHFGRQLLVERILAGWTPATAAEAAGVSRATAYKWLRRHREEGWQGLHDRSCRPHHSPARLDPAAEAAILTLRGQRKLGPHRLAALTGHPRSTVYKVLRRHALHRVDWLDRPTGRLIRRYELPAPGELVHTDVKKLGRIPDGGGWRVHGGHRRPSGGDAGQRIPGRDACYPGRHQGVAGRLGAGCVEECEARPEQGVRSNDLSGETTGRGVMIWALRWRAPGSSI